MYSRPNPHAGTSYITFTNIQLAENIKKPFTYQDALGFFRNKAERQIHNEAKDTHPYFVMRNACIVCADNNFEAAHEDKTNNLKQIWDMHTPIPNTITRFVIQLNLTEEYARKLYEQKKFDLLSINIIGAREDKISKDAQTWKRGIWQSVVRLDLNTDQRRCVVM